jgi:TPR repeat protein
MKYCNIITAADDDELAHPCPICLDNEDDAYVDGMRCGQCFACGQMYCGGCNTVDGMGRISNCPTCRAPIIVSDEENFKRLWKLVHDRSPGRHTPVAQYNLGTMYHEGDGVKQDDKEAVKWYRKAAEQGYASAQHNLGCMYSNGRGVKQDEKEAVAWYRLTAKQGHAGAQYNLGAMCENVQGEKKKKIAKGKKNANLIGF